MSQAHPTTTPEQMQTDTWLVFGNTEPKYTDTTNKTFIDTVEVPRYSQPNSGGVELNRDKRLALAVYRADEYGYEGETYWVLTGVEEEFEAVEYERNPAFDGVWDPEEDA